jgi:hypothetical protein
VAEPDLIKIQLTNRGEDIETPWAYDLGPAAGPEGSRRVRLANIPFLHAKPTLGDVLVVAPDPRADDGFLTWDRKGVAWNRIGSRIAEDGGNWAMIIDYAPVDGGTGDAAWTALHARAAAIEVACEGAWGPDGGEPGRAYLAVPTGTEAEAVMAHLLADGAPYVLTQIHPKPVKAKKPAKKKPKPANVKVKAKKPAKKKPAKPKPKKKPKTKPKQKQKTPLTVRSGKRTKKPRNRNAR